MDSTTAEKLYDTCYMKVYSYVMTLVRDQNAASEITQEILASASQKIGIKLNNKNRK